MHIPKSLTTSTCHKTLTSKHHIGLGQSQVVTKGEGGIL